MRTIVASLRGGPGSHYARRAALVAAAESGAPLYLLVIVPPDAYVSLHAGEQRAIRAEMAWRELALARSGASQLEVDVPFNVQIRIGELRPTLAEFIREVDAGTLFLGTPRSAADAALSTEGVIDLAGGLRRELAIEVTVVASG